MNRIAIPSILLALVAALAIAGCGSGGEGGGYGNKKPATDTADATAAPNPEEGATFVSVAAVPDLGRVLVDSNGHTLYAFDKDPGTGSACAGGCADVWPPLLSADEPNASNGAIPGKLGTTERSDGATQVTYAGHPLYTYTEDKGPGDAAGNGIDSFGGNWYALTPSGAAPPG